MVQIRIMISTYLDQIEKLAAEKEVDLLEACKAEGIAKTTLWRWRSGSSHPRQDTAEAILMRIQILADEKQDAAA